MKRNCFTLSPNYSRGQSVGVIDGREELVGTFLLAITVATLLSGAIWLW
jgi:hypothetical protein